MRGKRIGAAAVLLSFVIIAACFIPSENASDECLEALYLADETVMIAPENIDEKSSIVEIILSYERASAVKKYYESKGLSVEFHNPLEFKEGTFKGDLIGAMESEICSPPQNKCTDDPLISRGIIPHVTVCGTGYPAADFNGIDLEFLEEIIKFIKSRTDRIENCLPELMDALQKQQDIMSNVESLSAHSSIFYIDSRSADNRYRQSAEDRPVVYFQDDDSETDESVYDNTVIIFQSVEPEVSISTAEPVQTDSFNF